MDLLVERVLHGLDEPQQLELDALLVDVDEAQLEALERQLEMSLAAAANASALEQSANALQGPSVELMARLEADADRFFGKTRHKPAGQEGDVVSIARVRSTPGRGRDADLPRSASLSTPAAVAPRRARVAPWLAAAGWAAAAMLVIFVWSGRPAAPGTPSAPRAPSALGAPSPAESRLALVAEEATLQLAWSESTWAEFDSVRGDVVWNDARQEGYLRLVGMPPNDPARSQYQLWIVDPERDEQPVDGGVFDVPEGAGELVIPVRATLPVDAPVAFAITREQPGGVVVSDGPLLVVASRG